MEDWIIDTTFIMTPAQSNDIATWYTTLDEVKADGYSPVKATSYLCFYRLSGKRNVMIAENLEVIPDLKYIYLSDNKYYLKEYRGWDLDTFYWYRKSLTFSGDDEAVNILRHRIGLDEVWVLFTPEQVSDTSAMLTRLYSSYYSDKGKVPYRLWLELLNESLMFEDYKKIGQNLTGYRTVCKMYEDKIRELWKRAKEQQR